MSTFKDIVHIAHGIYVESGPPFNEIYYGRSWLRQARRNSVAHRVGPILNSSNERIVFISYNSSEVITDVKTLHSLIHPYL